MSLQSSATYALPTLCWETTAHPASLDNISKKSCLTLPSQVSSSVIGACTVPSYLYFALLFPPQKCYTPRAKQQPSIPKHSAQLLAYCRINTYLLDWWMNSVLPVSIIPCQSILIAVIFENLLYARHSIAIISFNFHTGTMSEEVLSFYRWRHFSSGSF